MTDSDPSDIDCPHCGEPAKFQHDLGNGYSQYFCTDLCGTLYLKQPRVPVEALQELHDYLYGIDGRSDCLEEIPAMQYEEYGKGEVLSESLEWCADELQALIDDYSNE